MAAREQYHDEREMLKQAADAFRAAGSRRRARLSTLYEAKRPSTVDTLLLPPMPTRGPSLPAKSIPKDGLAPPPIKKYQSAKF